MTTIPETMREDSTKPLTDAEKSRISAQVSAMSEEQRVRLLRSLQPRIVQPYMSEETPTAKQQVFLALKVREAMYGGAASGGKSSALLLAALQYVDVPGYSALIIRRTWPDLNSPGAILDRAKSWLSKTDATIREGGRRWIFPSGARLTFGTMLNADDRFRFQSAEYQFIAWDELTHFPREDDYTYMFSRLRRPQVTCMSCGKPLNKSARYWRHTRDAFEQACTGAVPDPQIVERYPPAEDGTSIFNVPLRMRSGTNPGGRGHEWVYNRFINPKTRRESSVFIPAFIGDNKHVDSQSYIENLGELSEVEKERLLNGDWNITEQGDMFERHYFKTIREAPVPQKTVRSWDNASTSGGGDWTVGAKVSLVGGRWVIEDIIRGQWSSAQKREVIQQTAAADGRGVPIVMEQEPGSSGVDVIDYYTREVLPGYVFTGEKPTGDKTARAMPLASAAEAGNVYLVEGRWNSSFLDEATQFPGGLHDDQVDAVSQGLNHIARTMNRSTRLLA